MKWIGNKRCTLNGNGTQRTKGKIIEWAVDAGWKTVRKTK